MVQINTSEDSNIIYSTSSGTLDKADYARLLPLAEEKIARHGKVRWYFEMNHFNGWDLNTLWKDLKFDLRHARDFEKIAMVGDRKWQEWMSKMLKTFLTAEIRYFDTAERERARQWIRE